MIPFLDKVLNKTMSAWLCYILCFAAGLGSACAMPPQSFWPAVFIGLSVLYMCHAGAVTLRTAFLQGFVFGLGYFLTGLWWIGNALLVEGNEFRWVWPLSVIGLPSLLSLFTGLGTMAATVLSRKVKSHSIGPFLIFTAMLSLSEWVRGHIFTGFPWNLYGYAWSDVLPVAQTASLTGSYGLTVLTVLWGGLGGFVFVHRKALGRQHIGLVLCCAILLISAILYGHLRLQNNPTAFYDGVALHIVQPNIRQDQKWKTERIVPNFEKHLELSRNTSPALADQNVTRILVWPETALPYSLFYNETARQKIASMLQSYPGGAYLLSGLLDRQTSEQGTFYQNSMALFDPSGNHQVIYSKSHLVPFGEYIPFQDMIPIRPVAQFSGFTKGRGPQTVRHDVIPAFSPLICYEIIFPGKTVNRKNGNENRPGPAWIVNATNDAWYGISAGPHQHFSHIVFRAIEEGIPVIRSANTGFSGLSDAFGRIVVKSNLFQDAILESGLPRATRYRTLYSRTGNLIFVVLCLFLTYLGFMLGRLDHKSKP